MSPTPPPLPTRFPCWCRAIYSWGGESKHDLGFIQGDLIECLNAGDGSWWVGRLYRDRRTVGLFPSNYTQVLPPEFKPTTKSTPMPASTSQSNVHTKSISFRKPFEAYAKAPHHAGTKQPGIFKQAPNPRVQQGVGTSYAHKAERHLSPTPTPTPAPGHGGLKSPSTAPSFRRISRSQGQEQNNPSAPPTPPPHRQMTRAGSKGLQMTLGNTSLQRSSASNSHFAACEQELDSPHRVASRQ
ncbi:hypothetical protein CDV36_010314 [Fusarium kuroshium]|uniref:SH3 domain-containing protein n=1 Tax=Fusarium kuroshium TaxID=2010991 RepID=A0A3M2RXR2_9HYPO|nr:hypothetical protein CDV36_010314 [Fusarium kuroshium]